MSPPTHCRRDRDARLSDLQLQVVEDPAAIARASRRGAGPWPDVGHRSLGTKPISTSADGIVVRRITKTSPSDAPVGAASRDRHHLLLEVGRQTAERGSEKKKVSMPFTSGRLMLKALAWMLMKALAPERLWGARGGVHVHLPGAGEVHLHPSGPQ